MLRKLQITIDDGPNSDKTGPNALNIILAELKTRGVKAAFFNLGEEAKANPKAITQINAAGHLLGNHSWDHLPKKYENYSDEEIIGQFQATHDEILKTHKIAMEYWRVPELRGIKKIEALLTTGPKPLYKRTHCDAHGISLDTAPGANSATMLAEIRSSLAKYPNITSPRLLFHVLDSTAANFNSVLNDLVKEGHTIVDFAQAE